MLARKNKITTKTHTQQTHAHTHKTNSNNNESNPISLRGTTSVKWHNRV